ncbi:MAG: hypothetical protein NC321_00180 [Clostridium sp.]|nr:hypothetical protein [Clostridium sp.]
MTMHNSLHGEIKEQNRKTKDMSLKGKLQYFWDYYKIHTAVILAVLALTIMFIQQYRANKDYAFYATLINVNTNLVQNNQWSDEFAAYAGIDTEEFAVAVDTSFILSNSDFSEYSISSMEKLVVMISAGIIDVIVADTGTFESQAQNEYYANLEEVLPQEMLDKYSDYLYYTDAATIEATENALYAEEEMPSPDTYIIDHHDPSSMEQPIPVGICLPEGNKLIETGCYDYLAENNTMYQGYPSEAVLGITANCSHIDTVIKFLEFLE